MLQVVSTVFILIAVYVAAVVIVNAVDTVLAGRLPPDRPPAPARGTGLLHCAPPPCGASRW